jgi:hypothetical protein
MHSILKEHVDSPPVDLLCNEAKLNGLEFMRLDAESLEFLLGSEHARSVSWYDNLPTWSLTYDPFTPCRNSVSQIISVHTAACRSLYMQGMLISPIGTSREQVHTATIQCQ